MGMPIDTVIQWLKIQRQNLKDFPEIASDKKIDSLDAAISYLEDYKQLMDKYQKIEEIVKQYKTFGNIDFTMQIISGVVCDGNDD